MYLSETFKLPHESIIYDIYEIPISDDDYDDDNDDNAEPAMFDMPEMPDNLGLMLNGLDNPPRDKLESLDDVPMPSSYEDLVRVMVVSMPDFPPLNYHLPPLTRAT